MDVLTEALDAVRSGSPRLLVGCGGVPPLPDLPRITALSEAGNEPVLAAFSTDDPERAVDLLAAFDAAVIRGLPILFVAAVPGSVLPFACVTDDVARGDGTGRPEGFVPRTAIPEHPRRVLLRDWDADDDRGRIAVAEALFDLDASGLAMERLGADPPHEPESIERAEQLGLWHAWRCKRSPEVAGRIRQLGERYRHREWWQLESIRQRGYYSARDDVALERLARSSCDEIAVDAQWFRMRLSDGADLHGLVERAPPRLRARIRFGAAWFLGRAERLDDAVEAFERALDDADLHGVRSSVLAKSTAMQEIGFLKGDADLVRRSWSGLGHEGRLVSRGQLALALGEHELAAELAGEALQASVDQRTYTTWSAAALLVAGRESAGGHDLVWLASLHGPVAFPHCRTAYLLEQAAQRYPEGARRLLGAARSIWTRLGRADALARLDAVPLTGPLPLGAFDLIDVVGTGATGVVWRARHRPTGASVAIKTLHRPAPGGLDAESDLLAGLEHPNIVHFLDAGRVGASDAAVSDGMLEEGQDWMAMELVEGGQLAAGGGGLRSVLLQILDALAHCHARGVAHLDLKPGNVLCEPDGTVRIADFGISSGDVAGRVCGTPAYMAPEQWLGSPCPASDLYALGCLAHTLATGMPPFVGSTAAVRRAHLERAVPPVGHAGLDAWIATCTAHAVEDRFPTAAAAARALPAELPGPPPPGRPTLTPTTLVLDALPVESTPTPAPTGDMPVPPDWRLPRRPIAGVRRAGIGKWRLRRPPLIGREREQDTLWSLLVRADRGEAMPRVVLVGPEQSGRAALRDWFRTRRSELGIGCDLDIDVAGPDEAIPDGCLVLRLAPLEPRHLVAQLEHLIDLRPEDAAVLAARADGLPSRLVTLLAAADAQDLLRPGPRGFELERIPDLALHRSHSDGQRLVLALLRFAMLPDADLVGAIAATGLGPVDVEALERDGSVERHFHRWRPRIAFAGEPDAVAWQLALAYLRETASGPEIRLLAAAELGDHETMRHLLPEVRAHRDPRNRVRALQTALEVLLDLPDAALSRAELAYAHLVEGAMSSAVVESGRCLDADPPWEARRLALLSRIIALRVLDAERALAAAQQFLEETRAAEDPAWICCALVQIARLRPADPAVGKWLEEAAGHYATADEPPLVEPHTALAVHHLGRGDADAALRAVAAEPDARHGPSRAAVRGAIHMLRGDFDRARDLLASNPTEHDWGGEWRATLALAELALGNHDQADRLSLAPAPHAPSEFIRQVARVELGAADPMSAVEALLASMGQLLAGGNLVLAVGPLSRAAHRARAAGMPDRADRIAAFLAGVRSRLPAPLLAVVDAGMVERARPRYAGPICDPEEM
ncbi:MAG: serine/threonine-protein kinase [Myxococcota bacterium]